LLIEYLNDLGQRRFVYTGSGSIALFGTAFSENVPFEGRMLVWFDDKEWVYDLQHNIWQIQGAYNTPNGVIWQASGSGTIRFFTTEELLKFEQGPAVFDRQYRVVIAYYENLLVQVNQKLASYAVGTVAYSQGEAPVLSVKNFRGAKAAPDINTIIQALDNIRKTTKKLSKNVHVHRTR
jgi:hypothetical protein